MDEQFNNDLKNRIKEVFDNYEDASAADAGWALLRERFPEERRSRAGLWLWWSAAAGLLLFIGLGIWLVTGNKVTDNNFAGKAQKNKPHELISSNSKSADKIPTDRIEKPGVQSAEKRIETAAINKNSVRKKLSDSSSSISLAAAGTKLGISAKAVNGSIESFSKTNNSNSAKINDQPGVAKNSIANNTTPRSVPDSTNRVAKAENVLVNSNHKDTVALPVKRKPMPKSMAEMFAQDKPYKPLKEKSKDDKLIRLEVFAATYFNYAKGSDNSVNGGGGVLADIRISKNLKLVTGMSVGQNRLSYDGGVPVTQNQVLVASAAANPQALASNAANITPTLKNYDANLVGLDIPLNLKYEFNPDKNDTYITAGLSSGTFINETYTSQYNYPSFFNAQQAQSTSKSFDSFYFARTLNVAFGVGYPIGKNRMVIEPFLKYPLEGMGTQQIKFGAGGINLKFNFQPSKK